MRTLIATVGSALLLTSARGSTDFDLRGIARVAHVRQKEPTLRYGREYFREISGDAEHFGHPIDGHCTLVFSRVLDVEEMVVFMNLDMSKRSDCVAARRSTRPQHRRKRYREDSEDERRA